MSVRYTSRFVDDDLPTGELRLGRDKFFRFIEDKDYDDLSRSQLASKFVHQLKRCGINFGKVKHDLNLDLSSRKNIQKSAVKVFASDEPHGEDPLYKQFNSATRKALEGDASLHSYKFGLLFWLMDSIYSRKSAWDKERLYRGVNCGFNFSLKNKVFNFNQFASFTTDKDEAKKFMSPGGTLFVVEGVSQMSISSYSPFPYEEEHLIHPEEQFKIVKINMGHDVARVKLKCL